MGRCGNHLVGFNLGYGFGNTEKATENMIFVDGKASKLEQVTFQIPGEEEGKPRYLEPWKFTSSRRPGGIAFYSDSGSKRLYFSGSDFERSAPGFRIF